MSAELELHQMQEQKEESQQIEPLILKLAGYATTTLVTIILTMIGFWLVEGRNFVTQDQVKELINNENKVVLEMLRTQQTNETKMEAVLEKNTEAIQQLRIQLSTLNNTLEFIRNEVKPTPPK